MRKSGGTKSLELNAFSLFFLLHLSEESSEEGASSAAPRLIYGCRRRCLRGTGTQSDSAFNPQNLKVSSGGELPGCFESGSELMNL